MKKEKQIKEMADDLIKTRIAGCMTACYIATELYNAGYRKEKQGEWKRFGDYGVAHWCSICDRKIVVEQGDMDMNYCPHCGARMVGDSE